MPDDETEAFLRDVRAALAAAPRPADPSREVLQRLATWLRTPASDSDGRDAAGEPRRSVAVPPPG